MMELRPIQAALLAGRSASQRATANPSTLSYPLIPSFYRCFSSTRPSLSEAEATAPTSTPTPSMQEWSRQQQQRQQQQQQQQPEKTQRPAWGSVANSPGTTGSMASLLKSNNATLLSPPTPSRTTPAPSKDNLRSPWATPTSDVLRRHQANRTANNPNNFKTPGIIEDLKDLGVFSPTNEDLLSCIDAMNNEPASEIKYRLRPSIGRTVNVDSKVDLARGLGLLNLKVRVNQVSRDLAKQRFHERPGLKRKRLRRERWRARFKDGFKATCKRVQDLARQGW